VTSNSLLQANFGDRVVGRKYISYSGQVFLKSKFWYSWKGLVIRKAHVKYESSMSNGLKVIGKVRVLCHR